MTDMRTKPRSRTITWDDPMTALTDGAALSGLEFIRAIFDGKLPSPPITATMGFTGGSAFFCCRGGTCLGSSGRGASNLGISVLGAGATRAAQ